MLEMEYVGFSITSSVVFLVDMLMHSGVPLCVATSY